MFDEWKLLVYDLSCSLLVTSLHYYIPYSVGAAARLALETCHESASFSPHIHIYIGIYNLATIL